VISTTGTLMTNRASSARDRAPSVGAARTDVVLFVGSGATAAVNKLVGLLGLCAPAERVGLVPR
jgi:hypothetical protein